MEKVTMVLMKKSGIPTPETFQRYMEMYTNIHSISSGKSIFNRRAP
jgi:hypothetical protein